MNVQGQIKEYITSQPEPKHSDMQELHRLILHTLPQCRLWFYNGKDSFFINNDYLDRLFIYLSNRNT